MNLKGYPLSKDYALLARLMKSQTIICLGRYPRNSEMRTLGKSLFDSAEGNDGRALVVYRGGIPGSKRYRVEATMLWLIDASTEAEFIEQCGRVDLEFVVPVEEELQMADGRLQTAEPAKEHHYSMESVIDGLREYYGKDEGL